MSRRPHTRRPAAASGLAALVVLFLPTIAHAQAPPAAPVNLRASYNGDRVRLTWDKGTANNRRDPLFYRVYRDGDTIGTPFSRQFDDSAVEVGTSYAYAVAGVDILGREGDLSATLEFTVPDLTPPTKPAGLAADALSASEIQLTWSASTDPETGIAGYYVYRDGDSSPHDSTASPGYTDTGLSSYEKHSYRVSAFNTSGLEGEKSDKAEARTLDGSPPTAPSELAAEAVSASAIVLDWKAATDPETGIARYYVYRDGSEAPVDSTTATSFTDDGLGGQAEFTYEVAAVNGQGLVGARSNVASARLDDGTPPTAPGALTAEALDARTIQLSWDAADDPETGIATYLVYRDGEASPVDSTTATTYADATLEPSTTYTYTVSARNGAGIEGAPSAQAEATTPAATDETPPTVPGNFSVTATGPGRVELSWTAAEDPESGVSYYRVYRGGNELGTSPGGGFTDLTVAPESTYEYEVAAVNGDGLEGPHTASREVTTPAAEDTVPPSPPTNLRIVTP